MSKILCDGWCLNHPQTRTAVNPRTRLPYALCGLCRERQRERERRRYARARRKGLCEKCGRKAAANKLGEVQALCEIHRRARLTKIAAKVVSGACAAAGCAVTPLPGHTRCKEHREEIRQIGLRIRDNRMAAGTCPQCGRRPLARKDDRVLSQCRPCLDIVAARMARRRETQP